MVFGKAGGGVYSKSSHLPGVILQINQGKGLNTAWEVAFIFLQAYYTHCAKHLEWATLVMVTTFKKAKH